MKYLPPVRVAQGAVLKDVNFLFTFVVDDLRNVYHSKSSQHRGDLNR